MLDKSLENLMPNLRMAVPILIALALGLAGCGSGEGPVMPDVVGAQLDVALSDTDRAGIDPDEVEVVGGGLLGVVDESNWTVCEQLPAAGTAVSGKPRLVVDRSCGDGIAKATESPTEPAEAAGEEATKEPPTEATPTVPADGPPLTVESNADFAAIMQLRDGCSADLGTFAARYAGATVAFDGAIVAMNPHDGATTRYDILVNQGDFSEDVAAPGPDFQFRDVNTTFDVHYSGAVSDSIGVGTNIHVVATVDEFVAQQCLFLLEPVETSFR
ncbi:DUF4839 domain-containing protein [Cellulomonas sp. S1-8]|uniref:DUF4839 domain-containing protein n=1 Tax=Cellulomonas sp. S1-8 TaxID=2904790 RepID=UPI0022434487|nr:DUF4839 domain-containing protein [Cellulomonas sp. S1-8]UZN04801.1 DUF4839 domain-containing protein [Cellulomonas sp. S1-8]